MKLTFIGSDSSWFSVVSTARYEKLPIEGEPEPFGRWPAYPMLPLMNTLGHKRVDERE
jgi:hypothetical protein